MGRENIRDVTRWFTDSSTGLRIPLTVDEIARNEMINQMVYAGMCAALSALNPGVSEAEISGKLGYDGSIPLSCHIVVSFGENVNLALNSPTNRQLRLGDPLSVSMGVWGANIARTGIAVHSAEEFPPEIADALEKVFVPYFDMLLRWYGALHVGANCGDVYEAVREYMEDPFFGIALNAGHLIRDEEWINAPFVPGPKDVLASGTMIQCDIIVPATPPYPGVHTEDGLVVADADLRAELAGKYPAVWERIRKARCHGGSWLQAARRCPSPLRHAGSGYALHAQPNQGAESEEVGGEAHAGPKGGRSRPVRGFEPFWYSLGRNFRTECQRIVCWLDFELWRKSFGG